MALHGHLRQILLGARVPNGVDVQSVSRPQTDGSRGVQAAGVGGLSRVKRWLAVQEFCSSECTVSCMFRARLAQCLALEYMTLWKA
jgi:hypothetical protein